MAEKGLAYNFASGWDGANTNLKQYENLLAGSPEYTADGSTGIGFNLFGEDNKLKFEDYFSTKNALSGSAAGPTKENAELIAFIEKDLWKCILNNGARSTILDIVEKHGFNGLREWFCKHGFQLDPPV